MDYKQTIKERLDALPTSLRAFVLGDEWRKEAEKVAKQFNLNEEDYTSFENEIFLVLVCFEPVEDFAENIKKEIDLDQNIANWITDDINKNIFSKVSDEIDKFINSEISKNNDAGPNKVGNDFEQLILNQARAMQPAKESSVVPENLPTGNIEPKKIHDYKTGNDPYREPAE